MPSRTDGLQIAILGGTGMLGTDLVKSLSTAYNVISITRENYKHYVGETFEVVVNANGNSKRFWAVEHPLEDFRASTLSVYESLHDFHFNRYIYISTADVYEDFSQPATTHEDQAVNPEQLSSYGLHKLLSEYIVRQAAKNYLIVRSCLILGTNLVKGPVFDALNGSPLFVTLDSRLQMITALQIGNLIQYFIDKGFNNETYNIGGRGTVRIGEMGSLLHKTLTVKDGARRQQYEMDVTKLHACYPLRTSVEYLKEYIDALNRITH